MKFSPLITAMLVLLCFAPSACSKPKLSEAKAQQFAQSVMRDVLPDMVLALEQKVSQSGAAAAVPFCNEFAPKYGKLKMDTWAPKAVAELGAKSFKFRRISARNRNPKNAPNEAQARILENWEKGTIKPAFYEDAGKFYTMHPIKISQPLCLGCHGSATDIDAKTAAEISKLYPQDKATGYRLGDLRGAFVTEIELSQ